MRSLVLASLALSLACDPASVATDAPFDDAGARDAPTSDTASSDAASSDAPASDAPSACVPTGGAAMGDAYCDGFFLSLFTRDDGAPRMTLRGRLRPNDVSEGACAVLDTIDVQVGGVTVTTLDGVWNTGTPSDLLAEGASFPELTERCAADEDRFGGFGFVLHGRVDGGSFTAHCADAEGGGRWPPAVTVSCHHNVEAAPRTAYAMVSSNPAFTYSSLDVTLHHASGEAITAAEDTVRVIPGFATAFGPTPDLDPFDSTGWTASIYESSDGTGAYSGVQLMRMGALPMELCPPPSTGPPEPGDPLPPVFLARIRGTAEHGAFSTEAYVAGCFTTSSP